MAALSIEIVLYMAFTGLALFLRLRDLTAVPLGSDEAGRAYQAWQLIEGGVGSTWAAPLPNLLAAGSFFLFGSSDLAARLGSALVGSALPALCWFLRPLIGRRPALWAALLLSVSPLAVYYSRALSGEIVATLLALGLVIAVFRYLQSGRRRFALLASGLLPALLLSDALAVGIVLVILLFFASVYAFGSSKLLNDTWQILSAGGDTFARMLALVLGGFLLISTALLTNLASFGLPTLGTWLAQFGSGPPTGPWYYHLELLLSYEPLTLVFGLAGLVVLFRKRPPVAQWWTPVADTRTAGSQSRWDDLLSPLFVVFTSFWTVVGLFLLLITASKGSGQVFIALLPLTLLAAIAIDRTIRWVSWPFRPETWIHLGILVSVGGFVLIMISQVTAGPAPKMLQVLYLILSIAGLLLVLASLWRLLDRQLAPVLSCVVLVALGVFSLHALTRTSHPISPAELIYPARTQPDVANVVRQIATFARQTGIRQDLAINLDPAVQQPFRWYLRNFKSVAVGETVPDGASVVIGALRDTPENGRPDGYVARVNQVGAYQPEGLFAFWRWLIHGETQPVPTWNQAIVQLNN